MSAAMITAICTGGVAIIGAVTALVKVFKHTGNTQAHVDPNTGNPHT